MRKKISAVIILAVVFSVCLAGSARGDWDFQRLSNNSGYSGNPKIVASGSNIHVVWGDNSYGNNEIFYKGSTDGGSSWRFRRISDNSGSSTSATIALVGTNVHVVWSDTTYGHTGELFYKRSTDNGDTWDFFKRITNNAGFSRDPYLFSYHYDVPSSHPDQLFLVWEDNSFGNFEILLRISSNNGENWPYKRLTNNRTDSYNPAFTFTHVGDYHYWNLVWDDSFYHGREILFKRDVNDGIHEDFRRLSNNHGVSENPGIASYGSNLHVLWQDDTLSSYRVFDLFYKRSTDGGLSWSYQRFTENSGISSHPDIALLETFIYTVWDDATYSPPAPEIFYKWSPNNGGFWYHERVSNNSGYSSYPSIAVTGPTDDVHVYVVWQDNSYGNYEIFFKRGP